MAITLQALPRQIDQSMRVVSFASDLTPVLGGPVTRVSRLGTRFALDISIPAISAKDCGPGLVVDLNRGETETIIAPVPEHIEKPPYGSPLVNGAAQTGATLDVDGLTPHVFIKKGKFFSLIVSGRRYVHQVTADTVADAAGAAELPIFPLLRVSPADNAVVELQAPLIEGFVAPGQAWDVRRIAAIGLSFTITERA